MVHERFRRVAGVSVALVVFGLVGCAPLPDGLDESARALAAALRDSPALTDVEVQVTAPDYGTGWRTTVNAGAVPDELDAAAEVFAEATASWSAGVDLQASLTSTVEGVPITMSAFGPEDVAAAEVLARVPSAEDISVFVDRSTINAAEGPLEALAASVRANADVGAPGPLGTVMIAQSGVSVELSAAGPSVELLDAIDALRTSGVTYVTLAENLGQSPVLSATVPDPEATAAVLRATPDAGNTVPGRPLTAFNLAEPWPEDGDTEPVTVSGEVGSDLPRPPSPPSAPAPTPTGPPPTDTAIRAFLEAASATAGVPAQVTTEVVDCDVAPLSRVDGRAFLDIFTVTDHAQDPYDAIVATWEAEGFRKADVAMGHVTYASDESDGSGGLGVDTATIWGTVDGLHVTVEGPCG